MSDDILARADAWLAHPKVLLPREELVSVVAGLAAEVRRLRAEEGFHEGDAMARAERAEAERDRAQCSERLNVLVANERAERAESRVTKLEAERDRWCPHYPPECLARAERAEADAMVLEHTLELANQNSAVLMEKLTGAGAALAEARRLLGVWYTERDPEMTDLPKDTCAFLARTGRGES